MDKADFQRWAQRFASSVEDFEANLANVIEVNKKENDSLAGQFAHDPNLKAIVTDISNSAIAYHRGRRDLAKYLRDRLEQDMAGNKTTK